jgi:hypothetical protein
VAFRVPNEYRLRGDHHMASDDTYGNNGAFRLLVNGEMVFCIASDGCGWEHVSVSLPMRSRCPTWDEMCAVKAMFWDADDAVVQYHPRQSEYVNMHPYVLHLWRPVGGEFPTPPPILVGLQTKG